MSGTASVEETLRNRHLRLINGLCLDMKTLNDRVGLPDPEKLQAFGELADKINTSFQALKSLDPTHFGEKSGSLELEPEKFSSILKKKPGTMECFGCGTTDTPEWRKGPIGPRTLCNACGLVYAKIVRRDKEEKNKPEDAAKQEQKMVKVMAEVIAISNMKQKKGRLSHSDFIPVDPSRPEEKVIKKAKKAAQTLASSSEQSAFLPSEQSAFLPYQSASSSSSSSSPASYNYSGLRASSPPPVFKISESLTNFSVDDHPPLPHSNAFLYSSELNTNGLVMNTKWIQQQHPPQFDTSAADDAAAADIKRTSLSFLLN